MSDTFSELIVARRPRATDALLKSLLIALAVATAAFGVLASPIFLLVFLGVMLLNRFLLPRFKVEYEYTYVNGEIDIAEVYSKEARKHKETVSTEDAECIAPAGSHHLDEYGSTYPVIDYSSGNPEDHPYAVVRGGENKAKILLHLDEKMLEDLKWRLPRKVFTD